MTSETTDTNLGTDEEAAPPPEHDYAHSVANDSASPQEEERSSVVAPVSSTTEVEPARGSAVRPTLPVEPPGPAVGAEVDCHDVGPSALPHTEEDHRKNRRRPKRPEDMSCSACKFAFERQGRSFNRRAVFTFTTPDTVLWVFPDTVVHDKSFLCETCAQVIRSKCKRKQSGKRALWLKPPQTRQSDTRDKRKTGRRMGKKSKAAQLVSKSCYKAAFKMLWSAKGARKPMMEFWSKQLKEEMKALTRQTDNPFHQKVSTRKPLSSFPWRRCLSWAQDKAPLVTTCLTSLFPDINALSKSSNQMSEDQAQTLLMRRAVVALSIPLFTRNIWKNNFLQAALGAELRLQGCSGSALDALNTMGLCQNKDTVRLLLHRLRTGKRASTLNGRQRMKIKLEQMKGEQMSDVQEGDIEENEEEEEEEEEEEDDNDDDDEEEESEEEEEEEEEQDNEIEMAVEELEVEEEEVPEEEEEDEAVKEKLEMEQKRRKKKAKKEKRKERGKRKSKERGEVGGEEEEEPEQKKSRVVVVRLGLLKGHSEVGRSDLSAP
ncbi:uncharacterized protein [Clinocottus analis]|uniref:uncharacterized protein n=1 Tax=Clinocottus analis TaxID=304258 RepID=UPI0035BF0423